MLVLFNSSFVTMCKKFQLRLYFFLAFCREISSAPRLIQVEGLERRADPYPHDYGSFEYDRDGKPIQYFEVMYPSNKGHHLMRVRVLTNWGHPVYTCVYRIRVHGDLVSPPRTSMADDDMRIDNE